MVSVSILCAPREEAITVGLAVEFYSVDPYELVRLLDADPSDTQAFDGLEAFPKADFSLHLLMPHDMDALCRVMAAEGLDAPATFREYLVKQVWCDDPERASASVTLVSERLTQVMEGASDIILEQVAARWASALQEEPPTQRWQAPSAFARDPSAPRETGTEALESTRRSLLRALIELRAVSRDALANTRAVLLYLVG